MKTSSAERIFETSRARIIAAIPVLAAVLLALCVCGRGVAQTSTQFTPYEPRVFDAAVTYSAASAKSVGGSRFWLQGGGAEFNASLYHGLGAAVSVTGMHASNITPGNSLGLFYLLAGPSYRFTPPRLARAELFAQGLVGVAHGFDGDFTSHSGIAANSSTSVAFELGGGMDISVSRRFSVRAVHVSWVRSQLPNQGSNVQNNLLLQAGVVFHLNPQ